MTRIFISYRRADSADVTGRIDDRLLAAFGRESVFKDVDSIPLGSDFRTYLDEAVSRCDVLLVIIGKAWLNAPNDSGTRRLDDENDYVRVEVESALRRKIPVVPVLVRGATMPKPSDLPPSISDLVFRNATMVRPDPDFTPDIERIINAIKELPTSRSDAAAAATVKPSPLPDAAQKQKSKKQPGNSVADRTDRRKADTPKNSAREKVRKTVKSRPGRKSTGRSETAKAKADMVAAQRAKAEAKRLKAEAEQAAAEAERTRAELAAAKRARAQREKNQVSKTQRANVQRKAPRPTTVTVTEPTPKKKSSFFRLVKYLVLLLLLGFGGLMLAPEGWLDDIEQLITGSGDVEYVAENEMAVESQPEDGSSDSIKEFASGLESDIPPETEHPPEAASSMPEDSAAGNPIVEAPVPQNAEMAADLPVKSGQILGKVFDDRNGDGEWGDDETGLPKFELYLVDKTGRVQKVVTDEKGHYETVATAGRNVIKITPGDEPWPENRALTTSEATTVVADETVECIVGLQQNGPFHGSLFHDLNNNGVNDGGRETLSNVNLNVTCTHGIVRKITTNDDGSYMVWLPLGEATFTLGRDNTGLPPGAVLGSGESHTVEIFGQTEAIPEDYNMDMTVRQVGSLDGTVYLDANGNCKQDADEHGLPDVALVIVSQGDSICEIHTDEEGKFHALLPSMSASIEIVEDSALPPGAIQTNDPEQSFKIRHAESTAVNIGFQPRGTVAGNVFQDWNDNGARDTDESGVANIEIVITGSDGVARKEMTRGDGSYSVDVPEGKTIIQVGKSDPISQGAPPGKQATVMVAAADTSEYNVPLRQLGGLVGSVFLDTNNNGSHDRNERGIPGLKVSVKDSTGHVTDYKTDNRGQYSATVPLGETLILVDTTGHGIPAGARLPSTQPECVIVKRGTNPARASHGFRSLKGFVWIPPGEFMMGNPKSRSPQDGAHPVKLTMGFYMSAYEVTQKQYETVMGINPSRFKSNPNAPVEMVKWIDAIEYCERATERDRASGTLAPGLVYTLPTEAQWEYACRAGTDHETFGQELSKIARYEKDQSEGPHPVGQKDPNPWGLYDMIGNVSEWCLDPFGPYDLQPVVDATGGSKVADRGDRAYRGASYFSGRNKCNAWYRDYGSAERGSSSLETGFRVVAVPERAR